MTVIDWVLTQVDAYGLAAVIGVLAVVFVAAWCLLGITLHAVEEYRLRRVETRAIVDLEREETAWEAADIKRGVAAAENYANHPHIRAAWNQLPAPKERGNA